MLVRVPQTEVWMNDAPGLQVCSLQNQHKGSPLAIPQNSSRNFSASFSPGWSWKAEEDGGLATSEVPMEVSQNGGTPRMDGL